jgi:hypothetical protein
MCATTAISKVAQIHITLQGSTGAPHTQMGEKQFSHFDGLSLMRTSRPQLVCQALQAKGDEIVRYIPHTAALLITLRTS